MDRVAKRTAEQADGLRSPPICMPIIAFDPIIRSSGPTGLAQAKRRRFCAIITNPSTRTAAFAAVDDSHPSCDGVWRGQSVLLPADAIPAMGEIMRGRVPRTERSPRLWAPLALLALAMNLLAPNGFMVSSGRSGPTIVICTGHGPATRPVQPGKSDHKTGHESACAFAGHGLSAAPPLLTNAALEAWPWAVLGPQTRADLAPGRGLAAPPPDSQGPPERI
jgi:hypothetical protein